MNVEDKPSLIVLRSHIGWPSPKCTDTEQAHGNPLGEDEVRATKEILGLPPDETFWVPDEVLEMYREAIPRGQRLRNAWQRAARRVDRRPRRARRVPRGPGPRRLGGQAADVGAGRVASPPARPAARCINAIADVVPGLIGGGADLTGNTGTDLKDHGVQSPDDPGGRLIYFGVREHGMGGDPERHGAARRRAPVRRHVLRASATTCARRCAWPR